MSDISIAWSPALGRGDWVQLGTQLQSGNDLANAVMISLFTDRVANSDDVIPDGTNDPRGWWGDDAALPIGSRLWLLSRAKQTTETLARAQDYIAEALQWLIDDGVVARFDILTEWTRSSMLGARVVAYEKGGAALTMNSASAWNAALGLPAQTVTQGLSLILS
jgi:phage gp46-like protein